MSRLRNMPKNNNSQKAPSAAARLSELPVVRTACSTLCFLYTDTKLSHPNLRSVCEGLESRVAALGSVATERVSPVIGKLEPQISTANDVMCKSLDWLETTFPVIHTPTDQIVATAKNKMNELQDVVSIAANGTMDCVHCTVTWVMERMQPVDDGTDHTLAERAVSVAGEGLDSALSMAEALMDRVLPPTEEDKKEAEAHLVRGFEPAALRRSYSVRLVSLTARLYQRTYHMVEAKMHSIQVMERLSRSSALVRSLQALPQYLQHQVVSVIFFITQMYSLSGPPSEQKLSSPVKSQLNAATVFLPHKDVVRAHPKPKPSPRLKPTKMSAAVKGYVCQEGL